MKKGSKGVPIELWKVRKIGTKELINFSEYRTILDKDPDQAKNYTLYSQTFYVYNYADIDGVPAMKKEVTNTVSIPELTSLFLRFVDQQFTWKLCTTSCKIMRISLNQKSRIPRTSFSANCFAEYFAKKSGEDFPRLGGPGSFDQPSHLYPFSIDRKLFLWVKTSCCLPASGVNVSFVFFCQAVTAQLTET